MAFTSRFNDPSVLVRVGAASLLAGALMNWFVLPAAGAWQDAADGLFGLLIGVTIASFLLAVRRNARRRDGSGDPPAP